jgi:cysteinyl-tRNA synthetase
MGWLNEYAGNILGLIPDDDIVNSLVRKLNSKRNEVSTRVEELLAQRQEAREQKDWNMADKIRDELNSMKVVIEDGPEGPIWKLEN